MQGGGGLSGAMSLKHTGGGGSLKMVQKVSRII
jgi:hypothetical protein